MNPLVCYFDDFLTSQECDHIIELATPHLIPATVCDHDPESKDMKLDDRRTNTYAFLPHNATPIVLQVCAKISKFTGIDLTHAEQLQVIHYGESEEYQPHYDAWDESGKVWTEKSGQRIFTALLYLNDVDEGGTTSFPNLEIDIKPKKGRIAFFANTNLSTTIRHTNSLHGAMPVISGEKWACNLWFREKPYVG
jgi:prolyl 4-hydroxylase